MIDARLALLTPAHVEGLVPSRADAALDYVVDDRVEQAMVWRDGLFARVRGYTGQYEVSVRARGEPGAPAQRVEASCTCDAHQRAAASAAGRRARAGGRGPVCRHAAAVLHLWARRRDAFVDLERLIADGADRPAAWWIELVGRLATESGPPLETLQRALWGEPAETAPRAGESPEQTIARAAELAAGGRGADAVRLIAAAFSRAPARMPPGAIAVLRDALTMLGPDGGAGSPEARDAPERARDRAAGVAREAAAALVAGLEADDPDTAAAAGLVLSGWEGLPAALTRAHLRAWELEGDDDGAGARLRQGRIVAWLVEQYERRGEPDLALAVLRQHRRAWGARERLIRRLDALGRLDEAIAEAAAALADARGYAAAGPRRWLGELLLRRGERRAAGEHLAAALALRPEIETYRLLRAARSGDPAWPGERATLLRGWRGSGQACDQLAQALAAEEDWEGLADLLQAGGLAPAQRVAWIGVLAGARPRAAEALYRQLLAEPLRSGDRGQRNAIAAAMTALARRLEAEGRGAERGELLAELRERFASDPVLGRRVARLAVRG